MRDETAIVKDGKDLFWKGGKVIFITFVSHHTILKVDRDRIALLHCVDSLLKLDHRKAVVDRVSKEDAGEGFDSHHGNTVSSTTIPLIETGL